MLSYYLESPKSDLVKLSIKISATLGYSMKYIFFLLLGLSITQISLAKPIPNTKLVKLADGFDVPWAIEKLGKNQFLITERKGNLILLQDGKKKIISGLPKIHHKGQAGLLDVVKDTEYNKNSLIFFTYAAEKIIENKKVYTTVLARAVIDLKNYRLKGLREIFVAKTTSTKSVHFGSRILVTSKHIYMTMGDRGLRDSAQELTFHTGKLMRINKDGSVPEDNPFVNRKNALPEIYSYGHRNPQGICMFKKTKEIFVNEHGPRGGDEINLIKKGANYGWPIITYGKEYWGPSIGEGYTKQGMEQPIKYFTPSIAPSSLACSESSKIPSLTNTFISGALVLRHLNVVSFDGKKESRFYEELDERLRTVRFLDDTLYFATDSGKIYKVNAIDQSSLRKK